MVKPKILFVFGTRPEAIKLAPVISALKNSECFKTFICVTAQHRQMLDDVLKVFNLKPDYDLDIMENNQTPSLVTQRVLKRLILPLKEINPDLIIVQGDTTSAFAAALLAFYEKIPIAHVEAGLRTYDKMQPFPEEINRRLITHLVDLHFPPTLIAKDNLLKENISEDKIFISGNPVVDALFMIKKQFKIRRRLKKKKRIILVTVHRRENWQKPLTNVCLAIRKLTAAFSDIEFYFPVHLNPNVRHMVYSLLQNYPQVILSPPLAYFKLIELLAQSCLVLTDSGGIQEEAPTFGVPVLILRNKTERPEAIISGTAKLVGTSFEKIFFETKKLLSDSELYNRMAKVKNPFGDGKAGVRIKNYLKFYYGLSNKKPRPFIV